MRPTIYGSENELGCVPDHIFDHTNGFLFFTRYMPLLESYRKLLPRYSMNNLLNFSLENMARFYKDTGNHPEYSTPECRTSKDVLLWQKAGEEIFKEAAEAANSALWRILDGEIDSCGIANGMNYDFDPKPLRALIQKQGILRNQPIIRFYKNCTGGIQAPTERTNGHVIVGELDRVYGEHENYLMQRTIDREKLNEVLLLHFMSRPCWQGAGRVEFWNDGTLHYTFSQREPYVLEALSTGTTEKRALINLRDESHTDGPATQAGAGKWYRLHIICGDANMSETVIRLKYVTTALLIMMVEDGYFKDRNLFVDHEDIMEAYHEFATDLSFQKSAHWWGRELRIVDIQRLLLDHAKNYINISNRAITNDIQWGIEEWGKTLDLLESPDPEKALLYRADYPTKKIFIDSQLKKLGYAWENLHARQKIQVRMKDSSIDIKAKDYLLYLDLKYHWLHPDGVFYKLPMARHLDPQDIRFAMREPPTNTRAHAKKKFVKAVEERSARFQIEHVDWQYISIGKKGRMSGDTERVYFPDPFEFDSRQLIRKFVS